MTVKRELAAAEDAAWAELIEIFESLPSERLEEPGYFAEGWSVKDLMAHIASWQAEAGRVLQWIRNGTYVSDPIDVDAMNRDFYERNRELSIEVVRSELWSARTRMLIEWNALPEVTTEAEEWFRESGPLHYQEHLPRLKEWAQQMRSG